VPAAGFGDLDVDAQVGAVRDDLVLASLETPPKDSDMKDANGCAIPGPIDDGEACLAYVAVTRTCQRLDMDGLSWIDHHPDGNRGRQRPPHARPYQGRAET
jgi:hypothetical protein